MGKRPLAGDGQFQWNTGGWFGGQVGSTLWIVLLGGVAAVRNVWVGLLICLCGVLPNLLGLYLWNRRDRIKPYAAIQILLGCVGVLSLAAVLLFHLGGLVLQDSGGVSITTAFWYLLLYPLLMLCFFWQEMSSRKRKRGG